MYNNHSSLDDGRFRTAHVTERSSSCAPHAAFRFNPGFTLVELMVVISIIAVLISLLLPSLSKARQTGQQIQCLNIIRQYSMANALYADNNQDWYVPIFDKTNPNYAVGNQIWTVNPSFFEMLGVTKGTPPDSMVPRRVTCPVASFVLQSPVPTNDAYNLVYCYGFNSFNSVSASGDYAGFRRSQILEPSSKLCLSDSLDWWIDWWDSNQYVDEATPAPSCPAYRHSGGVNIIFYDSHAASLPREQVDKNYLTWTQISTGMWYLW